MNKLPYMESEMRVEMKGKGAPRPTVFNVIGHTKYDSKMKSLGGLVKAPRTKVSVPKAEVSARGVPNTDRHIIGMNKTNLPGEHYSQIPFAGAFMKHLGKRL